MSLIGRPRTHHPDRPATPTERSRARRATQAARLASLEAQLAKKVYHRSTNPNVATPWEVFTAYDAEFHFTLDVCATAENTKCARFFSPEVDGLTQDWGRETCWMNPPYGKGMDAWMEKAYLSSLAGAMVLAFVAARTDTRWWHGWVLGKGEVRYRLGRTTFEGYADPAGYPSVAVIYRPFLVG